MNNIKVWREGENQVAQYLKEKGYKIVYTNFSCKIAELDIVAILSKKTQKAQIKSEIRAKISQIADKTQIRLLKLSLKGRLKNLRDLLIIVEVKARSSNAYGLGLDAISKQKINHMKRGAEVLTKMKKFKDMQVRFDVASVDSGVITYIENAF